MVFRRWVRPTKPISAVLRSRFMVRTSSRWLWLHPGCQNLGGMETSFQHTLLQGTGAAKGSCMERLSQCSAF